MNVREIQQILLNNTYTKPDYIRRLTLIREYLESRFFAENKINFSDYLVNVKALQIDREALSVLDEHFFHLFTKDNVYLLINGLTESLKVLPTLTLYLAVMLDDYQIIELGKWFRQNLNPELIIDVRCNPTLVSGCSYVWNNRYKDLSLHYFLSKKQELINRILDAYAKQQL